VKKCICWCLSIIALIVNFIIVAPRVLLLQDQNTSVFMVFGAVLLVMDHSHVWEIYGMLAVYLAAICCIIQKYKVGCHSWVWYAAMHSMLYYFYFLRSCFILLYSVCVSSSVYCTHTLLVTCVSVSYLYLSLLLYLIGAIPLCYINTVL